MDSIGDLKAWVEEYERKKCVLTKQIEIVEEKVVVEKKGRGKRGKQKKLSNRCPVFDKKTKDLRFAEEKGICQWCHQPIEGKWHAHHIKPRSQGGDNSPKNLMVLHPECHLNPIAYWVLHPGMELPKAFNASRWRIA